MDNPGAKTFGSFFKEFRTEARAYLEIRFELARLSTYEKTAHLLSISVFFAIAAALISLVLLFLSVSLAFYIGKIYGDTWFGFLCVGLTYFLLMGVMAFFKKSIIEGIQSATIGNLMKSDTINKSEDEQSDKA